MAAVTSRPVRLARPPVAGDGDPAVGPGGAGPRAFVANDHGNQRGFRLFLLFLACLLVIYLAFAVVLVGGPGGSVALDLGLLLGVVAGLLVGWGWWITWARAPKGLRFLPDGSVLIVGRFGGRQKYPAHRQVHVAYHYPRGLFNAGPVELVEVWTSGHRRRPFLLNAGLLDDRLPQPRPGAAPG